VSSGAERLGARRGLIVCGVSAAKDLLLAVSENPVLDFGSSGFKGTAPRLWPETNELVAYGNKICFCATISCDNFVTSPHIGHFELRMLP
jgi:hypothetical protein